MNNRKFAAAVLEGGPASEKERMDAIAALLAKNVNEALYDIIDEIHQYDDNVIQNGMKSHLNQKFKALAPDLFEKYDIQIYTSQDVTADPLRPQWKAHLGWRRRYEWETNASEYTRRGSFQHVRGLDYGIDNATITNIDATRITAGAINAERIAPNTMDGINTGEIINTRRIVQQIRDQIADIADDYLDLLNNTDAVHEVASRASRTIHQYQERGLIQDWRLDSVTTPQGHPDVSPSVSFSITPNQMMQRVNIEVNLRP